MTRVVSLAQRGIKTATIADAQSLSTVVDFEAATLCGIVTGSGWTTAAITFRASIDGVTFVDLYNAAGNEVSIPTAAASRWYAIDPADFAGIRYLIIRSGTSATPVNQAGGDTLTLVTLSV